MLKRPVKAAVRLGLDHPGVRRLVESELAMRRPAKAASGATMTASGSGAVFTDSRGVAHPLDPGLRDRLKPGWRAMTDPVAAATPPTESALKARARAAESSVGEAVALAASIGDVFLAGRILEIGCYDGAVASQLATRGNEVVASDLARYYVVQRPGQPDDEAIEEQSIALKSLRERARFVAGSASASVRFVEDDIVTSELTPGSFDAIVSFEVLEHVRWPEAAFQSMARLLRPGGLLYHVYNPFFSAIGGHSLCTLDFDWGHARLSDEDFECYVNELRPVEAKQALRFYRENLNRMTQADVRDAMPGAGLEVLAIIPWFDRGLAPSVTPSILTEVRRTYPSAVIDDLLATFVTVVARLPVAARVVT
jgi:SAM-dependent methyltransferase